MQFSDAIKAIKDRLNLADFARRYVDLKPNGSRFTAPCPFHQETKPSFYIFPDRQTFYCFGCQASGDIIEFYCRIAGLDFREAISQLADEAGITIDKGGSYDSGARKAERTEKQQMLAMHELACSHFQANLGRDCGSECREYIERRGLSPEIQERFSLGWAEREWRSLGDFLAKRGMDANLAFQSGLLARSQQGRFYDRFRGRLMFPIRNLSNQIIAFGGRIIADEDEAKYINSSDTPIYGKKEHLFGLSQARRGISARGFALLTEGYMDVLTLHQFGYDNGVGVLGTALTDEQIDRLAGFTSKVMLLFDGDPPGRKAASRAAEMFIGRGLDCKVILLPDPEDIDSLLRKFGKDAFEDLIQHAPDGMTFLLDAARRMAPRESLFWARNFLAGLKLPELCGHYESEIARGLGLEAKDLRKNVRQKANLPNENEKADFAALCERDTQIMVFAARYPDRLEDLRNIGADLALTTKRARLLWDLIEEHGPEAVIYYLDEKQKRFWISQAGPEAPPRTTCEAELACLKQSLDRFYATSQAKALRQTFSRAGNGDFAADMEFLQAIRDTMRKTDEQS